MNTINEIEQAMKSDEIESENGELTSLVKLDPRRANPLMFAENPVPADHIFFVYLFVFLQL